MLLQPEGAWSRMASSNHLQSASRIQLDQGYLGKGVLLDPTHNPPDTQLEMCVVAARTALAGGMCSVLRPLWQN